MGGHKGAHEAGPLPFELLASVLGFLHLGLRAATLLVVDPRFQLVGQLQPVLNKKNVGYLHTVKESKYFILKFL
jgi:hypothetical protein